MLALALFSTGCEGQRDDQEPHEETVDEQRDEQRGIVRVSELGIERSGIRTEPVRRERLVGGVDVPAEVQLNPNRTAHVTPMVAGQIDEVHVSLGDSVKEKQTLATMRSVALGEARSAVANARAALSEPYDDRPACNYCGQCTRGCPRTDKGSVDVTFIPKAEATGNCTIRTESTVLKILAGKDDRVTGVEYIDQSGARHKAEGQAVIVACGAV